MTIATSVSTTPAYACNGAATVFPYGFKLLATADMGVILQNSAGVNSTLVYGTDFTLTGVGNDAGGNIVTTTAYASGNTLTGFRVPSFLQGVDLQNQAAFFAQVIENALDLAAQRDQYLLERVERSIQLPITAPSTTDTYLPLPEGGKVIAWNEEGTGLQNVDSATLATIVAFGTTNADTFVGNGATVAFTLSANPGSQANLGVSIDGFTLVPGVDYVWTSGTTITFTTAPSSGAEILARYSRALPQGTADAGAVSYTQGSTGAVARTVLSKFQEFISVKDFGAVGNGVTDDSAAVQAALNAAIASLASQRSATLYIPEGSYVLGSAVIGSILVQEKTLNIVGGGVDSCCFMVTNTTGGILIDANNNKTAVHLKNVWFACEIPSAGTGFRYRQTPQTGPASRRMFTADNVTFRPTVRLSANYFDICLHVEGFYRPLLNSVVCWLGQTMTAYATAICKMDSCYAMNLENSYFVGNAITGISSVGGAEEGGWIAKCIINGPRIGINLTRTGREPNFSLVNSHVNTREVGVYVNGIKFFTALDNLIYCKKYDESLDENNQPVTFKDFHLADCDASTFIGNSFRTSDDNLKRYHYFCSPGGVDENGNVKTNSVVRNIQTSDSGYYAALGAGYCPIKVEATISNPSNLYFDLPEFVSTTDNASYPTPYWSVSALATDVRIAFGQNIVSFGEGAASVPVYHYQVSSTPAVNDAIVSNQSRGNNSSLAEVTYSSSRTVLTNVTPGAEAANVQHFTMVGGALVRGIAVGNGLQVGSPAGGDKGTGSLNLAGSGDLFVSLNNGAGIYSGTGTPLGVVSAAVGSLFLRTDGGAATTLYVKESGTGNTGWVAK